MDGAGSTIKFEHAKNLKQTRIVLGLNDAGMRQD